jgi:RHS repeat-associated protein
MHAPMRTHVRADAIGNRLSQISQIVLPPRAVSSRTCPTGLGAATETTYHYPTTSHRLASTTGGTAKTYSYDNIGNMTGDGTITWKYAADGRLKEVTGLIGLGANTVTYDVNAMGQRVRKVAPDFFGGTTRFMYDEQGRLSGEYDAVGKLIQETVWLNDLPIATLRPKAGSSTTPIAIDTFYIHADHLGTPRAITRPSDNQVVWRWDNTEPFGNNAANENPSGLGNFKFNLRFDGTYYDEETNTLHNGFRTLSAAEGRYLQSDPLGLAAGPATYAHVSGQPLTRTDRFGLFDGSNFLPQVAKVCTTAGTTVATGVAMAVGAAVFALTPSSTSSCDTMDKPNSCLDDCEKIERQIAYWKGEVIWRYFRMLEDAKDLYNKAMIKPLSSRSGTWVGHVQAFQQAQKKLREVIELAKAKGCKVDPDAVVWANTAPPNSPVNR